MPLGLEDIMDAELRRGLQQLLDYEGNDVEDVFCLMFEVTWMELGEEKRIELKPGGGDIPVTFENKEEYVLRYVRWLLVDSIQQQWDSFEKGVMVGKCIQVQVSNLCCFYSTNKPYLFNLQLWSPQAWTCFYPKS